MKTAKTLPVVMRERADSAQLARAFFRRVIQAIRRRVRRFLDEHVPECFGDGVWCRRCGDVHRDELSCPDHVIGIS
jgi:hypothetical protein